jgi:GTP cyclohydrolase I
MSTRGIRKQGITMETFKMIGAYEHDAQLRTEFLASVRGSAVPQPG